MGIQNVSLSFAFVARFCLAIFAISSPLAFGAAWDGDRYIRVDSHASGKEVWQKNPWYGQPLKNEQAISKAGSLQPQYKNKPLPPVPVTLSATPDAVKAGVKNLLRGGLAGVAITEGISALFDAVDWVLDPANNSLQYPESLLPEGMPSNAYVPDESSACSSHYTLCQSRVGINLPSNATCYQVFNGSTQVNTRYKTNLSSPNTYNFQICTVPSGGQIVPKQPDLLPVAASMIDSAVDDNYNLHEDDISQLVAERSEGAFVKPNVVFIGDSPSGSVSLSQFPVSDVTNTESITIPHPNSSTTEPMTMNYNYDGKSLPVTVPPNVNNSSDFTMDIAKTITTTLDFTGTNQPAKSITYNSNTEQYELAEPLSDSDSPVLNYTVITTENYVINNETVYNSSTTNDFTNDNEIVVKDSIFPPFCDWASVVCDFLDWFVEPPEPPDDGDFESLRPKNIPIPNLDMDILEADKNCPAPKELTIASLNTTLTFKYDQICSAVEAIRPFFLIICYISAARIVLRA